jgi:hypothetical protein
MCAQVTKGNIPMYELLMEMSGEDCYTLTLDNPAKMYVEEGGIEIVYPTGNMTFIPRDMVEKAIDQLTRQGYLTVKDVHEGITNRRGPLTDRLFAVLRKLPGVTSDKRPRKLYYPSH